MISQQNRHHLYDVLIKITNIEDMEKLLSSLCSESELDKMSQRLLVAKMFSEGAKYSEVKKVTNASSATLAKIKFDLLYGNKGLQLGV